MAALHHQHLLHRPSIFYGSSLAGRWDKRKTVCPPKFPSHDSPTFRRGRRRTAEDVQIQAKEILVLRQRLNEILAAKTGQTLQKIAMDSERDFYMGAQEAKEYGLIDEVVSARPK